MDGIQPCSKHGTIKRNESNARMRYGFNSSENGRSETVKRRAKRHFAREDQYGISRLAGNGHFGLGNRHRLRRQDETQDAETEIRLEQDKMGRRGDKCFEGIAG